MMPERALADTNLFLRYLTNDVPEQAEAVECLLRRAAAGQLVLVANALVIAEIVWTLETFYRLPKPAVRDRVIAILNTPGLEVEDAELLLQAIVDYVDRNIDFADAYNGAWSLARGIATVYTFDLRHFSRIPGLGVRLPGDTGG